MTTLKTILIVIASMVVLGVVSWGVYLLAHNAAILDEINENLDQALNAARRRDYEQAIKYYDQALELDPELATAWRGRGAANVALGRLGDALQDYTRWVELEPDNPNAYLQRGEVNADLGHFDTALQDYEDSLQRSEEVYPGEVYPVVVRRAERYFLEQRYREAERLYRQIITVERIPIPEAELAQLYFSVAESYFQLDEIPNCLRWLWDAYQLAVRSGDQAFAAHIVAFVNLHQLPLPALLWTATPSLTPSPTSTATLTPSPTLTVRATLTPTITFSATPTTSSTSRPLPTWTPSWTPSRTQPPPPPPPTDTHTPEPPGPCSCSGDLYNCEDFDTQQEAQDCYDHCITLVGYDIHGLDGPDCDGVVCESLP
ncbi:MAG: tetratricopeptide repeat protein [Anaerolineales bacterium]|nr:tetratricopeptide repeat protein [Anaerolineales bacterium]